MKQNKMKKSENSRPITNSIKLSHEMVTYIIYVFPWT